MRARTHRPLSMRLELSYDRGPKEDHYQKSDLIMTMARIFVPDPSSNPNPVRPSKECHRFGSCLLLQFNRVPLHILNLRQPLFVSR